MLDRDYRWRGKSGTPQTFRHVLTEYVRKRSGRGGMSATYTLTEEFADFTVADDLTLPRTCKLRYTSNVNGSLTTTEWNVAFDQIRHK
jgi:hypothetical protein